MFKSRSIKFKTQAKNTGEHQLVKICMSELCKKAGFVDCVKLIQRDLVFLCGRIEAQTGVLISISTIKRLLNGQFSRLPQIATLDAIAIAAGYQNWQTFKINISLPKAQDGGSRNEPGKRHAWGGRKFMVARILFFTGLLAITFLGFLAIRKSGKSGMSNIGSAKFSVTKVTRNDIPNTVVFGYNIDSVNADSFFIQQSWDRNKRIRIFKHSHTLTDIYYEPGYHVAKLIANDSIIRTQDVSIPTGRWFFYAREGIAKGRPEYITTTSGIKAGRLQLTKEDLMDSKVDIQKENLFFNVYFPSHIESSSDNFVLKFRIKVNALKNEPCPFFVSEIFCQRYFMYFESGLKGCSSESLAQYGEKIFNGKTNDLSALGTDVRTWQNVELTVKNKNVNIKINGADAFSTIYHESCGLITGLGFIANGLCEVSDVDLKTIDGKDIYSEDFNNPSNSSK